jgi:class 3 adenylate cyclase
MKPVFGNVWKQLERLCTLDGDSSEISRDKVTLVVITGLSTLASIIWGTLYYVLLGPAITTYITFGFTVIVGMALFIFFVNKRFSLLLYVFIFMILWNPIAMQWSLGGFAASGVLMLWSLLAPFSSLMFQNIKKATGWFLTYLTLLFISLYFDEYVSQWAPTLSNRVSMTFFGMNLIGPSMIIYASMMYYVNAFQREHNKSEKLLLNILPSAIADRLKQKEEIIADGFEEVTILFADIVNFTKLSARISPNELVTMLNKIFSAFDRLAILYGLEKIKTIGDAYMVVGGLPLPRDDHAEVIADMALNMQEAMKSLRSEIGEELRIRIGINTGSVVAGVIGIQKFSYDLWGDAVNTASRMESQGLVNCIQLTETTYKYLKDKYVCKQRGFIEVKGKGKMKVYLLKGKIPGTPSLVLDAV